MGYEINQIPIVLHTMDSYSHYWNPWYALFKKHVKNHGPIYFMSEELEPDFVDDVIHIKTGKGEWGKRLLNGLEKINHDLIFYMQEDFWAINDISLNQNIIDDFLQYNMDSLRISFLSKHYSLKHISEKLYKFNQNSNYTMTHQFGLWKKSFFQKYILPHETPWQNEILGSQRINKHKHNIYIIKNEWYVPTVRKGKITDEGIKILKTI